MLEGSINCCGFSEYVGLNRKGNTARIVLAEIATAKWGEDTYDGGDPGALVLFTEITRYRDGPYGSYEGHSIWKEVKKLIEDEGLGMINSSSQRVNPNTGNRVRGHFWAPSWRKFRLWARQDPEFVEAERRVREDRRRYNSW